MSSSEATPFSVDKYFIKARSASEAAAMTPTCGIRIYYRLEDIRHLVLPLMLVYRDCEDNCFHIPLERYEGRWQLSMEGTASFSELGRLLNHYEDYLLTHPGKETCWEAFPVWKESFIRDFKI